MELAAHIAGFAAAHQIWSLSQGAVDPPCYLYADASGERFLDSLIHDRFSDAVEAGRARLEEADGALAKALVYDAQIGDDGDACRPAVVVQFGNAPPELEGFILGVPYTPAVEGRPFAVHAVEVVSCPAALRDSATAIASAFMEGVKSHAQGWQAWQAHFRRNAGGETEPAAAAEPADIESTVNRYLAVLVDREPLPEWIAHLDTLYKLPLDFSLKSLGVLDALFAQLRPRLLAEEIYLADPVHHRFLALIAFYLGKTVARCARAKIRWYEGDAFREKYPQAAAQLPASFRTSIICVLNEGPKSGFVFAPLARVTGRLFDAAPKGLPEIAQAAIERAQARRPAPLFDITVDIRARCDALPADVRRALDIEPPPWSAHEPFKRWFEEAPRLLEHGRVVWGHLIQANSALFQPGDYSAPGELLYDPQGVLEPAELAPVARAIFRLKGTRPEREGERLLADHLTSEITRAFGLPVPCSLSSDGLRLSTVFIHRPHLPNRRLSLPYLPLLICDDYPGVAMILPACFWPQGLAEAWGVEEEPAPPTITLPSESADKDQVLHVVAQPVPEDDRAAWELLEGLLARECSRGERGEAGLLGRLRGLFARGRGPAPPSPHPAFIRYLGRMTADYPAICDLPFGVGDEVLTLVVASESVNYVVETARREFGLVVFASSDALSLIYRP